MAGDAPKESAEEKRIAANLQAIRTRIDAGSNWKVRDVDMMANGSAFLFYLRSKGRHRFLNQLNEIVEHYTFDTSIMVPAELVNRSIDKAVDQITATAKEDLKRAKSSA